MRYAIISDIHANASALRSVLTDAQDCGAEQVICLGDVLGYGPEPVETLEIVYKRVHVCLAGNHDDAICGRSDAADFSAFAATAAAKQSIMLSDKAKEWLRSLPYVWGKDGFACAHGDFSDPKSFYYISTPDEAMFSWKARKEKLLFVGHTHEPGIFVIGQSGVPHEHAPVDFQLEAGKRYIVNVGSVGYPRSGSCRSCYVIWDDRTRVVTFRTLPFDLEGYREKMNGRGLEEAPWIGRRQKERERPSVREDVKFGTEQSAPVQKPDGKTPSRAGAIAAGLVAAAALAAAAGWLLSRGRRQGDGETPPPHRELAQRGADAATASQPSQAPAFGEFRQHVDGWSYAVESEKDQTVSTDGKPSVLKVTNNGSRRVAFRKEIALRDGGLKLHVKVKVLPKGVGTTQYELCYFDGEGVMLGSENKMLDARSKDRKFTPPKGAARARLTVEYSFSGTAGVELPYFTAVSKADDD